MVVRIPELYYKRGKPAKIDPKDIPAIEAKGIRDRISISMEVHGALLMMGTLEYEADFEDFAVCYAEDEDEGLYIVKGSIKILWEDMEENKGELTVSEGELAYLPGGHKYTFKATGKPGLAVFAQAPPFSLWKINQDYHKKLLGIAKSLEIKKASE